VIYFDSFATPIGTLTIAADETGLRHIEFPTNRHPAHRMDWLQAGGDVQALREAREQLLEYFAGVRRSFELVLQPVGTPFQLKVWEALARIPYGETWSYGDLAKRIGSPAAVRAVGAANGSNPLPIVLPCHRVIGANGKLTGFGGGLDIKAQLLRLEGAWPDELDLQH
jgi:O-6-methylguanine DNA methyltransferase